MIALEFEEGNSRTSGVILLASSLHSTAGRGPHDAPRTGMMCNLSRTSYLRMTTAGKLQLFVTEQLHQSQHICVYTESCHRSSQAEPSEQNTYCYKYSLPVDRITAGTDRHRLVPTDRLKVPHENPRINHIYINDPNTFSSDLIPFCCSVFLLVPFFSLLYPPSPDVIAP
jgi:hypothetical protein